MSEMENDSQKKEREKNSGNRDLLQVSTNYF